MLPEHALDRTVAVKLFEIFNALFGENQVITLRVCTVNEINLQYNGYDCGIHCAFVAYQTLCGLPTKSSGFSVNKFREFMKQVLRPQPTDDVDIPENLNENTDSVSIGDLERLEPKQWLNDAIMLYYIVNEIQSSKKPITYVDSLIWSPRQNNLKRCNAKRFCRCNVNNFDI